MVVFRKIRYRNFLSSGNSWTGYQLDQSPVTLIVGKNGSGKSMLLDALTFVLFGKPYRNINIPQLVNSINQKNCEIEIEFSVGQNDYKVIRGLKPRKFEIWKNGELLNQDANSRDYQKVLENIIKLNYKTCTQVVILGSANFVPFMELKPSVRREIIEDIMDIKVFSGMNQLLKNDIANTNDAIRSLDHGIELYKERAGSQKQLIKTLEENKDSNIKLIDEKIQTCKDKIVEFNKQEKEHKEKLRKYSGVEDEKKELENQIAEINTDIQLTSRTINSLENSKSNLEYDICPSCKTEITEEHKHDVQKHIDIEVEQEKTKLNELHMKNVELTAKRDKLHEKQEIHDKLRKKLNDIQTQRGFIQDSIQGLEQERTKAKTDIDKIQTEKDKLTNIISDARESISKKKEVSKEKYIQEITAGLLKDSGVKTTIIKEYLPVINKLINHYLSEMDFFAQFVLDESFNEVIKSRYRDKFSYLSFSEGEKQRIDLAILFTWRQLAKMKNSVNTNLLLLDEVIDKSLDEAAIDTLFKLLEGLENHNIFIISHRENLINSEMFDEVLKVEKQGNFSVISKGN